MEKSSKLKFKILCIICIVFSCIGVTYRTFLSDTFYVIKLGEYILKNGIDLMDHFSWVADLSYTYPHWLYDVVIYLVYHNFGYFGVYASVIICFIFLSFCIYYVNVKMNKNYFLSLIVTFLCICVLVMFAVARSQIVSLPLFLLEVYFLEKLSNTGKNRYIVYICLISLIIANVHATAWLFLFVLFLPFIGEWFVSKISKTKVIKNLYHLDFSKNSKVIIEENKNIKKVFITLIFSFLMGIFSPSRICYTYVIKIMMGNSQNLLLEHLPLTVIEYPFFLILVVLFVLTLILNKSKVYLRELFMILGLLLMSLISTRHLQFFYTIGILYIVLIISRTLSAMGDNTFEILGKVVINNNLVYVITIIFIICFAGCRFYSHLDEDYVDEESYPVTATYYIKENLDYENLRIFNSYDYGSYLMFNDIPVFVDSRCDLYLKEFNGMSYSIFDELETIILEYEERFEYYDVDYVLLSKSDTFYFLLMKDTNYSYIDTGDKYFALFERIKTDEV